MEIFSGFRFPSSDASEVVGLQNLIRSFRSSIARGDEVPEAMVQDFCKCLRDRDFYDFAKAHFPLIRSRGDAVIADQDPVMARIMEAAAVNMPAPYHPPRADTVEALLAQKYALLMLDIVERGALGGRKIGPEMKRALCLGLAEVFEIVGKLHEDSRYQ